MKSIQLLIFTGFNVFSLFSQNTPQLLNSSGMHLLHSNLAFDIAIGEPIISTYSDTYNALTQGYLQPYITQPNSAPQTKNTDGISVYPNPFNHFITVESNIEDLNFRIADATGRVVYIENEAYILPLSFLSDGIYSLIVFDKNGNIISNIKICKTGY